MMMRSAKRQYAWDLTDGRCYYCGFGLLPDCIFELDGLPALRGNLRLMQVDHIVARARGGSDDFDNLLPACDVCNAQKGDRSTEEFRVAQGFRFGHMPHRFACEPSETVVERDYLVVASKNFRGGIMRRVRHAHVGAP
jgi:hypothetical protein